MPLNMFVFPVNPAAACPTSTLHTQPCAGHPLTMDPATIAATVTDGSRSGPTRSSDEPSGRGRPAQSRRSPSCCCSSSGPSRPSSPRVWRQGVRWMSMPSRRRGRRGCWTPSCSPSGCRWPSRPAGRWPASGVGLRTLPPSRAGGCSGRCSRCRSRRALWHPAT